MYASVVMPHRILLLFILCLEIAAADTDRLLVAHLFPLDRIRKGLVLDLQTQPFFNRLLSLEGLRSLNCRKLLPQLPS